MIDVPMKKMKHQTKFEDKIKYAFIGIIVVMSVLAVMIQILLGANDDLPLKGGIIIDIRTPVEYNAGHIDGAVNIPYTEIEKVIPEKYSDKNTLINIYDDNGSKAKLAKTTLSKLGYIKVSNLKSMEHAKKVLSK